MRWVFVSGMILMVGVVMAQPKKLPRYECYRTADAITVDGKLEERTWRVVPQMELVLWDASGLPKRKTSVRMAWDDTNLYLAFSVVDDDIRCKFTQRDDPIYEEECVEFFLDPGGEMRHYFEFEWNALGACLDLLILEPPKGKRFLGVFEWDAKGMEWGVSLEKGAGWRLEVAIPFKLFVDAPRASPKDVTPKDGDAWRMNLYRIERSDPQVEYSCWSPVLGKTVSYHRPKRFGFLVFRNRMFGEGSR